MHLQLAGGVARPDALGSEPLALANPGDVVAERRGEPGRVSRRAFGLALEDRLAGRERPRDVAPRPGVGEGERRRLRHRRPRAPRPRARRSARHPPTSRACRSRWRAGGGRRRRAARSAAHASGSARAPAALNCSATHAESVPLRHVVGEHLARLGDSLRERRVRLQLAATSASTVPGAGVARYAATAFTSAAFQLARTSGDDRRAGPRAAEEAAARCRAATASSPLARGARAARPPPRRRGGGGAASARPIFGPVAAGEQVDGLRARRSATAPAYSTLRPDAEPSPVRLDRDAPVQVGAVQAAARRRASSAASVDGARMAVVVVRVPQEMTATAGRSSLQLAASPGSAEPWCATFRISTAAGEQARRDVGLGVGGQERVDARRSVASRTTAQPVRIVARRARAGRARARAAAAGRAATRRRRASRRPGRAAPAPPASASPLVRARSSASCGSRTRSTPTRRSTSSAPPMWSRCGCVRTSAASRRTPSPRSWRATSRLRRALVDEHRSLRHLHEHRVALADVEERDPQPRSAAAARLGPELPDEQRAARRPRAASATRRPPPARQPPEQQERGRRRRAGRATADAGADLRRTAARRRRRAQAAM